MVEKYIPMKYQREFSLQEYMTYINRPRPDLPPVRVPEYHESPITWGSEKIIGRCIDKR